MKFFALIITTILLSSCSVLKRSGKSAYIPTSCTAYSYMKMFREVPEEERYAESKILYDSLGHKTWKYALGANGDTGRVFHYLYNAHGLLDIYYIYDDGEKVAYEHYYDTSNNLLSIRQNYRGYINVEEERNYENGLLVSIDYQMGGRPSSSSKLTYNDKGQHIKTEILSTEGEYWGYKEYTYTKTGKMATETNFGEDGTLSETTTYQYNVHDLLEWKIVTSSTSGLLAKVKYEYE